MIDKISILRSANGKKVRDPDELNDADQFILKQLQGQVSMSQKRLIAIARAIANGPSASAIEKSTPKLRRLELIDKANGNFLLPEKPGKQGSKR